MARRKRYLRQWLNYRHRCHKVGGYMPIRFGFANAILAVDYPRYRRRMKREGDP